MPQEGFQNDTPERECAPHLLLDTRVIQVILSRVLTRLLSSELAHMGTTDGRNQYTKLGVPKALGSYKRGQPLFIAGSLEPWNPSQHGGDSQEPGASAGNLRIHHTEGPQALIKRPSLQLPASSRPFL